jgi:phage tail-like protein
MALTKQAVGSAYPLPAYNYKVTVGADTFAFSEVSGLAIAYEMVTYKHGFSYVTGPNIIRGQAQEITITLKRGVVQKRQEMYAWLTDKSARDLAIDLCDEKGLPVVRWQVSKAIPFKIEAPAFNAAGNDVALESVELIAKNVYIQYL